MVPLTKNLRAKKIIYFGITLDPQIRLKIGQHRNFCAYISVGQPLLLVWLWIYCDHFVILGLLVLNERNLYDSGW